MLNPQKRLLTILAQIMEAEDGQEVRSPDLISTPHDKQLDRREKRRQNNTSLRHRRVAENQSCWPQGARGSCWPQGARRQGHSLSVLTRRRKTTITGFGNWRLDEWWRAGLRIAVAARFAGAPLGLDSLPQVSVTVTGNPKPNASSKCSLKAPKSTSQSWFPSLKLKIAQ